MKAALNLATAALMTAATFAADAGQEAPVFTLDAAPAGTVYRWNNHNGQTRLEVLGEQDGRFYGRWGRDGSQGAAAAMLVYWDAQGRTLGWRSPFGETAFDPHDCFASLGECRYEKKREGAAQFFVMRTRRDGDLWRYSLHRDVDGAESLVEEGSYSTDPHGVELDRRYRTADGAEGWTRRTTGK